MDMGSIGIPKSIKAKPFTYVEVISSGLTRHQLRRMLQDGQVERVSRGVYRSTDEIPTEDEAFRAATLRVGEPSSICLISALAHYHLTDTIPRKTWIMVPAHKRSSSPDIKVFRVRDPEWTVGISKERGYSITSLERTLIDCLVYRKRLGTTVGVDALRQALSRKETTVGKLVDMAKALKVTHRVLPYLEAMS